jgi:type IV pilus assembly protein PilB
MPINLSTQVELAGGLLSVQSIIVNELLSQQLIDEEDVASALERAKADGITPLQALIKSYAVNEEVVFRLVADAANLPFVALDKIAIDQTAAEALPSEWANRLGVLPYAWEGEKLLVATTDPTGLTLIDDIKRITKYEPVLVLSPEAALLAKIQQVYRSDNTLQGVELDGPGGDITTIDLSAPQDQVADEDRPIIQFVEGMITSAVTDRASDIHIEPKESSIDIRFRIDGVLQEQNSQPKTYQSAILSRIKILAQLDIAEKRVPQDGRVSLNIGGRPIDLRVATLPTVYGEKVVMRILDNSSNMLSLDRVGLSPYHQDVYKKYYNLPHGMILMTGPTGSGKSTTLYATLGTILNPELNIITVEDPVEYRMDGVNQIQINEKAGLTFAASLRSILRSDPDVLLVGEIRDTQTATIAIQASLTGHMVLSTLHTNDASSAVTRLVEMGVEPFLVGSAVSLVVAQRLVRRLCEDCREPFEASAAQLENLGFRWPEGEALPTVYAAKGCDRCSRTGYKGRLPIHEMLQVTSAIQRMISEGTTSDEIQNHAVSVDGMRLMREDGFERVLQGETTIEEVLRVVG